MGTVNLPLEEAKPSRNQIQRISQGTASNLSRQQAFSTYAGGKKLHNIYRPQIIKLRISTETREEHT